MRLHSLVDCNRPAREATIGSESQRRLTVGATRGERMPEESPEIEVKADDVGVRAFALASGRTHRLVVPASALDWKLCDKEGNPCSFFRYELVFKPESSGAVPPPVRGFLDENGRLLIDPAPLAEFDISVYDEFGTRVSARRMWVEESPRQGAPS